MLFRKIVRLRQEVIEDINTRCKNYLWFEMHGASYCRIEAEAAPRPATLHVTRHLIRQP